MVHLGVNVDHVATLRQARYRHEVDSPLAEPDPVALAAVAEKAGAAGITVHLREDRRHIQERDVRLLKKKAKASLNLEMAVTPAMVAYALALRPDEVCLVPENRQEVTTEGGLDLLGQEKRIAAAVKRLSAAGIVVSLFIDPEADQIEAARRIGAPCIELHTGAYANALKPAAAKAELARQKKAAILAPPPRPPGQRRARPQLQKRHAVPPRRAAPPHPEHRPLDRLPGPRRRVRPGGPGDGPPSQESMSAPIPLLDLNRQPAAVTEGAARRLRARPGQRPLHHGPRDRGAGAGMRRLPRRGPHPGRLVRHRRHPARPDGAGDRAGRRGDLPQLHLLRHRRLRLADRGEAGLRRQHPVLLQHRSRRRRGADHAAHQGDPPRPPLRPARRDGRHPRRRRGARPARDRGRRPVDRREVQGPRHRHPRRGRVLLVLPPPRTSARWATAAWSPRTTPSWPGRCGPCASTAAG